MKKIVFVILAWVVLFAPACSLDEHPYSISSEALANDPNGAEQLVTGIYSAFWSSYMMKKTYQEWVDMDHDLNAAPDWVVTGAGQGNVTTHWGYNGDSDLFNVMYLIISRCNAAKESLEAADLENPQIGQRYGEVLFLRAWAYFHLVRMYGPVPLRLTAIAGDNCARASVSDVYEVITTDLKDAVDYLRYPSEGVVGSWGHADETAARILLARVYCTMASGKLAGEGVQMYVNICNQAEQAIAPGEERDKMTPLKWTQFTTQKVMGSKMEDGYAGFDAKALYGLAKDQCDAVIERRGIDFDLMPSISQLWGGKNFRNKEFVWGVASYNLDDFKTDGGPWYYIPTAFGGGGYCALSDGCWQMYDYKNDAAQNDERAVDGVFHYWKNGGYKEKEQWYRFPTGDMRYNTAPDGLKPDDSDEYVKDGTSTVTGWNRGAAFPTKYYWGDVTTPTPLYTQGNSQSVHDLILIRYAEAYLLRAEALNELGRPDEAIEDLNVIRNRAKARAYPKGLSQINVRSYIFQERGIEFVQEFNRRFDLIRWGMYLNVMNATQTILNSSNQVISLVREERCLLTAVPTAEIQKNALFGLNNPGW